MLSLPHREEDCGKCQWRTKGGVFEHPPPPEIPKAPQKLSKINPIVKNFKNF